MLRSFHTAAVDQSQKIQSAIILCLTAVTFIVTFPAGLIAALPQKIAWGFLVGIFIQFVTKIGNKRLSAGLPRSLFQSIISAFITGLFVLLIASVSFANLSSAGERFSRALSLTMIQEPFLVAIWTLVSSYIKTTRISWKIFGLLCLLLFLFSVLLSSAVGSAQSGNTL